MFMGIFQTKNYTQRLFQMRGEDELLELNETMVIL